MTRRSEPEPAIAAETFRRRRRSKNLAVGFGLLALVVLFYLITLVKIGGSLP